MNISINEIPCNNLRIYITPVSYKLVSKKTYRGLQLSCHYIGTLITQTLLYVVRQRNGKYTVFEIPMKELI